MGNLQYIYITPITRLTKKDLIIIWFLLTASEKYESWTIFNLVDLLPITIQTPKCLSMTSLEAPTYCYVDLRYNTLCCMIHSPHLTRSLFLSSSLWYFLNLKSAPQILTLIISACSDP